MVRLVAPNKDVGKLTKDYSKNKYANPTSSKQFPEDPVDRIGAIKQRLNTPEEAYSDFGDVEEEEGYIDLNYPLFNALIMNATGEQENSETHTNVKRFFKSLQHILTGVDADQLFSIYQYNSAVIADTHPLIIKRLDTITSAERAKYNKHNILFGAKALSYIIEQSNIEDNYLMSLEREVQSKFKISNSLGLRFVPPSTPINDGEMRYIDNVVGQDISWVIMPHMDSLDRAAKGDYDGIEWMSSNMVNHSMKILQLANTGEELRELAMQEIKDIIWDKILMKEKHLIKNINLNKEKLKRLFSNFVPVLPNSMILKYGNSNFSANPIVNSYQNLFTNISMLNDVYTSDLLFEDLDMLNELVSKLKDLQTSYNELLTFKKRQKDIVPGISQMMKAKKGWIRRTALGKDVRCTGRAVVAPGPHLSISNIILPYEMAKQIYSLHLVNRLGIDPRDPKFSEKEIREGLKAVMREVPLTFNRQPTLHRISTQGFYGLLDDTSSSTIKMPPNVTNAYNADFDGDKMVTHVPSTDAAIDEVKNYMMSSMNVLKPRNGEISTSIKHETIYGIYIATSLKPELAGGNLSYDSDLDELLEEHENFWKSVNYKGVQTTVGRVIMFELLDKFVTDSVGKDKSRIMVNKLDAILKNPMNQSSLDSLVSSVLQSFNSRLNDMTEYYAELLRVLNKIGFSFCSYCPPSVDLIESRQQVTKRLNVKEEAELYELYSKGFISEEQLMPSNLMEEELANENNKVKKELRDNNYGIIDIIDSGARCSNTNIELLYGVKGVIALPNGMGTQTIHGNYLNGLDPLEHCLSSMSTLSELMLKTLEPANTGYSMRKDVHYTADLMVHSDDCGTETESKISMLDIYAMSESRTEDAMKQLFQKLIIGRYSKEFGYITATRAVSLSNDAYYDFEHYRETGQGSEGCVYVRLLADCKDHICAKCYGMDITKWEKANIGLRAGILAATSIGEVGTQSTMKVFQQGGKGKISSSDLVKEIQSFKQVAGIKGDENHIVELEGEITIKDNRVYIGKTPTDYNPTAVLEGRYILPYQPSYIDKKRVFSPADLANLTDKREAQRLLSIYLGLQYAKSDVNLKHSECVIDSLTAYKVTSNPNKIPYVRTGKVISKRQYREICSSGGVLEVRLEFIPKNLREAHDNSPLSLLAFEKIGEAIHEMLYVDELKLDKTFERRLMLV